MTTIPGLKQHAESWNRRHLLDLESLSAQEITTLLDVAQILKDATEGCRRKLPLLTGEDLR